MPPILFNSIGLKSKSPMTRTVTSSITLASLRKVTAVMDFELIYLGKTPRFRRKMKWTRNSGT